MKTIGKYEIRGLLGRGGMSVVYKARIPVVGRMVALKLLSPHPHLTQLLGKDEIERRFIREATTIATLHHPHVVEILDFDYADGIPFFTMEYYFQDLGQIMGESRRAETPSRILSLDKSVHYGRQILLGLARLHRAGLIHRDIKPFNLLVNQEDILKICDFGICAPRGEKVRQRDNLLVGSPYYAAPEQERNPGETDTRADIFSAGVVFHRMLTGELPGEGELRPSTAHPDADTSWDEFVFRAVSLERESRFPSAQAMLQELERLGAEWNRRKREICSGLPLHQDHGSWGRLHPEHLRSDPVKIAPDKAGDVFRCDTLGRPLRHHDIDLSPWSAVDLVLDRNSGLLWQRSGSPDPLEWSEAQEYIASMNSSRHGGLCHWRLPTVNELFSLLKPFSFLKADCMEAIFDSTQRWLWSADRRSFVSAWYVNTELGFVGWGDFTCRYHVRAVCRPRKNQFEPAATTSRS